MLPNKRNYLIRLGNNIRKLRKKRGITQEKLAFDAGIDRSYMGGIERGERNFSILIFIRIAYSLKSTLSELTNGIPK